MFSTFHSCDVGVKSSVYDDVDSLYFAGLLNQMESLWNGVMSTVQCACRAVKSVAVGGEASEILLMALRLRNFAVFRYKFYPLACLQCGSLSYTIATERQNLLKCRTQQKEAYTAAAAAAVAALAEDLPSDDLEVTEKVQFLERQLNAAMDFAESLIEVADPET